MFYSSIYDMPDEIAKRRRFKNLLTTSNMETEKDYAIQMIHL